MSIHKKFKKAGQHGVTLLLSILVLAAILSIAFSLATVTFIEIRSSGDLVRTEPTYYAADAISEAALFTVKRNVSDTTYPYDSGIGTVSLTSNTSFISTAIFQATVPKTSFDFISTRSHFPIYDTQCPSPNSANMANCPTGGSGYGRIKITYLDTGNTDHLKVFLCEFDPSKPVNSSGSWPAVYTSIPCSNPYDTSNYYWLTPAGGDDLTSGNTSNNVRETGTGSWPNLNPNLQQELIFYNSGSTADIHVQIETFDSNGVAKGLPLVGSKAVDITASSQGVVRKIRTTIPTSNGSNSASSSVVDTVWVEDSSSAALASPASLSGDEPWNWVASNPAPYSGSQASQSSLSSGEHQHYFSGSANKLNIGTGDKLFAYIYIDPANVPTEVMLQWNSDSQGWNHRAYWGASNFLWGTSGTQTAYPMGVIPSSGQWVRLEVPASVVGLEGQVLNGMAFSLYGGKATWDYAGKSITVSSGGTPTNVALASAGATASASTEYNSGFPASATIDGERKSPSWGSGTGGWNDGTSGVFPDWLEVDFSGTKTINEIDVFTLQDIYWASSDPTPTMTFNNYGITNFDVQYFNGSSWVTVPGGNISGNLVWTKVTFPSVSTSKIRVLVNGTADSVWSRITEIEAYTP